MVFGERLRAARKMAGFSMDTLARQVGVSKQAISKYEHGQAMPRSGVLLDMAEALDVAVDFFLRPNAMPVLTELAYRAHHSKLGKKQKATIEEMTCEWLERYLELESLLPADYHAQFEVPMDVHMPVRSLEDVEQRAIDLREAWHLGMGALGSLTEVLELNGVKVHFVDAPDGFDGLSYWADDLVPVVVVTRKVPGDRQRLSMAHELGHLLLKVSDDVHVEKAALRFAGALLVPQPTARRVLGRTRSNLGVQELDVLKHTYGLSMQAWVHRAWQLGVITTATKNRIVKKFRSEGWHTHEPGRQYPRESTQRMRRLAAMAVAEGYIGEAKAAELLNKKMTDLDMELAHPDAPAATSSH